MTQLMKIIIRYSLRFDLCPHVDKDKHEKKRKEYLNDTSEGCAFPIDPIFTHQSFVMAEATHFRFIP